MGLARRIFGAPTPPLSAVVPEPGVDSELGLDSEPSEEVSKSAKVAVVQADDNGPAVLERHLQQLRDYIDAWSMEHQRMVEGCPPVGSPTSHTREPVPSWQLEPMAAAWLTEHGQQLEVQHEADGTASYFLSSSKEKEEEIPAHAGSLTVIPQVAQRQLLRHQRTLGLATVNHVRRRTKLRQKGTVRLFFSVAIVANAVLLGLDTCQLAANPKGYEHALPYWNLVELGFCILYSVELLWRLCVYRAKFFGPQFRWWHGFEIFLAVLAWQQHYQILQVGVYTNITYLRVFRLMKDLSMAKLLNVLPMFHEVRIILDSILGCGKALVLSIAVLFVLMYTAAMLFMRGVADAQRDGVWQHHAPEEAAIWTDLRSAMSMLFMAVLGGVDWRDAAFIFEELGPFYYYAFFTYVLLFQWVIQNTITAMFVDALTYRARVDGPRRRQTILESTFHDFAKRRKDGSQKVSLKSLNRRLPEDRDRLRYLSYGSFPELADLSYACDLSPAELPQLFQLMTDNGSKELTKEEFVEVCLSHGGNQASSLDLALEFQRIRTDLDGVRKHLGGLSSVAALSSHVWESRAETRADAAISPTRSPEGSPATVPRPPTNMRKPLPTLNEPRPPLEEPPALPEAGQSQAGADAANADVPQPPSQASNEAAPHEPAVPSSSGASARTPEVPSEGGTGECPTPKQASSTQVMLEEIARLRVENAMIERQLAVGV